MIVTPTRTSPLLPSPHPPTCRLSVQGQDHHRHSPAAGGGQAAHDEGEVVAGKRLSGGGEQGGQRPGRAEHRRHLHRAGCRTGAVRVRGRRRGPLQVQAECHAGEGRLAGGPRGEGGAGTHRQGPM